MDHTICEHVLLAYTSSCSQVKAAKGVCQAVDNLCWLLHIYGLWTERKFLLMQNLYLLERENCNIGSCTDYWNPCASASSPVKGADENTDLWGCCEVIR